MIWNVWKNWKRVKQFSYLQSKDAIKELFSDVAVKVANRPGGYTRILKTGFRAGDSAEMCMIELVDYNESMLGAGEGKKKSRRRSKKSTTASNKTEGVISDAEVVEVKSEDVVTGDIKEDVDSKE